MLSAVRWLYEFQVSGTLWLDSAYVATGLIYVLDSGCEPEYASNEDLWADVTELVLLLDSGSLQVQHVAGHRQVEDQSDPVDEWTAHWNGCADTAAMVAHDHRSLEFQELQDRFVRAFLQSEKEVDQLRDLHLALAEQSALLGQVDFDEEQGDEPARPLLPDRPAVDGGEWLDGLPLGWLTRWIDSEASQMNAPAVARRMIEWLQVERTTAECGKFVSWLELSAMLVTSDFDHPLLHSVNGRTAWVDAAVVPFSDHQPPTVALRIQFLKSFFRWLDSVFQLDIPFVSGIDLSRFSVHSPQTGVTLMISAPVWRQCARTLLNFTSNRAIRAANDLSRPFV